MLKKLILFAASISLMSEGRAATALTAGDIAIIGYHFDTSDQVAFVTWVDLTANTVISFTDSGYIGGGDGTGEGAGGGTYRASEGVIAWDSGAAAINAGSVVVMDVGLGSSNLGSFSSTSGSFSLSASGDQIFSFQGAFDPGGNPSTLNGTLLSAVNSDTATWGLAATSTNNSGLPTALSADNVAIAEVDNAEYTGMRSFTDLASAQAAVLDSSNWTGSNAALPTLNAANFTIIPEPSGFALIALSGLIGILRRRR